MGDCAPRKSQVGRLLPQAVVFSALLLAFATALPFAGEARVFGLQVAEAQSEVRTKCTVQPPGRAWIRGAPLCSEPSALPPRLRRVIISGTLEAALAANLHCRISPTNVSQFMHKATGCMPHAPASPRVIFVKGSDPAEWPANRFEPAPDSGMIEPFTVGRLPDG